MSPKTKAKTNKKEKKKNELVDVWQISFLHLAAKFGCISIRERGHDYFREGTAN